MTCTRARLEEHAGGGEGKVVTSNSWLSGGSHSHFFSTFPLPPSLTLLFQLSANSRAHSRGFTTSLLSLFHAPCSQFLCCLIAPFSSAEEERERDEKEKVWNYSRVTQKLQQRLISARWTVVKKSGQEKKNMKHSAKADWEFSLQKSQQKWFSIWVGSCSYKYSSSQLMSRLFSLLYTHFSRERSTHSRETIDDIDPTKARKWWKFFVT